LVRRYLVWCYKTTKEELDRIDRYFTQLKADRYMRPFLTKGVKVTDPGTKAQYLKKVGEFDRYVESKEQRVLEMKFADVRKGIPRPEYLYLKNRLRAVEQAIRHFLGAKGLAEVQGLYENEMTERILKAREHT